LAKEKPPIFGMLQRGGEVVIRMLANVKQVTIGPLIERTKVAGCPDRPIVGTTLQSIMSHEKFRIGLPSGVGDCCQAGCLAKIVKFRGPRHPPGAFPGGSCAA